MKARALILTLTLALLAASALIAPVAASTSTISIRDLAHLTSDLKFNGSPSFGYRPTTANVRQGSIVTFTNVGIEDHTVTSFHTRVPVPFLPGVMLPVNDSVIDSSPSVPILTPEGGSFADAIHPGQTFTVDTSSLAVGTYTIFCRFHPWMLGAIVVSLDGQSAATVRISDSGRLTNQPPFFSPFAGSAEWGFLSRTTTVKQGTTVVWTNDGFIQHTVTSGIPGAPDAGSAFNSGFAEDPAHWIFPGLSFSLDTSKLAPGVYPYHCDIHGCVMAGTIHVT